MPKRYACPKCLLGANTAGNASLENLAYLRNGIFILWTMGFESKEEFQAALRKSLYTLDLTYVT